jgi:hypothetical protein
MFAAFMSVKLIPILERLRMRTLLAFRMLNLIVEVHPSLVLEDIDLTTHSTGGMYL